jgi:hypothetical protein
MTFRSMLPAILLFAASSICTPQASLLARNASQQARAWTSNEASDQKKSGHNQTNIQGNQPGQKSAAQTLSGIVEWEYKPLAWDCDVPNCDHFALYDDKNQINYELDDARKALPFEGKRAKVTGVVDAKNHVIHLISIEAEK